MRLPRCGGSSELWLLFDVISACENSEVSSEAVQMCRLIGALVDGINVIRTKSHVPTLLLLQQTIHYCSLSNGQDQDKTS